MTGAADPASRLAFDFDALNRLERATQSEVPGMADFTLTYAYYGMTNVVSVTDKWGVQVASEYDSRNRLARRVWQGGELPGASLHFAYDAAGSRTNILRFADTAGTQLVGQSRYAYNALGAITDILHANGTGAPLAEYHYERDPAQQIIQRTIGDKLSECGYDLTGQLTNAVYTPPSQPNESYPYDAEGSLVARTNAAIGATTAYGYDHRNRLASEVDKDAGGTVTQIVEFTYDAMNRRIAKGVNGALTRFLHNHENIWADADPTGSVTARYLLGNRIDEMLARHWLTLGDRKSVV